MTTMQMKAFLTLASCLNFTEAAGMLFMTQPALSRQIVALEKELNILLFSRDRRSVRLTPAGELLRSRIEELHSQYLGTMDMAKSLQWGKNSHLKIGVLTGHNVSGEFPALFRYIEGNMPDISVSVFHADFEELNSALYNSRADAIVTLDRSSDGLAMIEYRKIMRALSYLVVHTDNHLAGNTRLGREDLRDQTFISASAQEQVSTRKHHKGALESEDYHMRRKEAGDLGAVMLMLQSNIGIGVLNSHNSLALNPRMRFFDPTLVEGMETYPTYISLAWLKSNINPALPMLLDAVVDSGAFDLDIEPPIPVNVVK